MITAWFRERNLPEPPLPAGLRVTAFGPNHWGVRDFDPMDLYLLRPAVLTSLLAGGDQLAVCHAGHGVNSYAITYCVAHRGLVLITQVGWGGVYMDNSARAAELAEVFEACGALIARRVPDGRTLVCVESRMRGQSLCGWHPEIVPVARGTALTSALALLT
jgi:hypothetical protein